MGWLNVPRLFGIRQENLVGEEEEVEIDQGADNEFEWDYEEVPFFGKAFTTFPNADQQGNEEDASYQEGIRLGMQDASEGERDPSSVFVPWQGDAEAPQSVFVCQRSWKPSIKCRLWMTSAMLLAALVAFPAMLLLPMGTGQGAWPLSDTVTCQDYTPQLTERYLHICKTVARVAILPMATGLLSVLVLNAFQLSGLRQKPRLMSAILCYVSALIYVVYIAVLPYQCASSSPTAALSFSLTFFQFLALLLVPCLQQKEDREEDKAEEDQALGEARLLLDPSVVRTYYHLTAPLHTVIDD